MPPNRTLQNVTTFRKILPAPEAINLPSTIFFSLLPLLHTKLTSDQLSIFACGMIRCCCPIRTGVIRDHRMRARIKHAWKMMIIQSRSRFGNINFCTSINIIHLSLITQNTITSFYWRYPLIRLINIAVANMFGSRLPSETLLRAG